MTGCKHGHEDCDGSPMMCLTRESETLGLYDERPCDVNRYAIFTECPLCGGELHPEHAHFKCRACGFRDSCCD